MQEHIEELFDSEYGGFGDIPKFPQTSILGLMGEFAKLTGDRGILDKFLFTLRKMGNGEIFDSNRGGFLDMQMVKIGVTPEMRNSHMRMQTSSPSILKLIG